jgi:hypothetical protein
MGFSGPLQATCLLSSELAPWDHANACWNYLNLRATQICVAPKSGRATFCIAGNAVVVGESISGKVERMAWQVLLMVTT